MHLLTRHLWLITTGIATAALVTLLVSGLAVHRVDHGGHPPRPAAPAIQSTPIAREEVELPTETPVRRAAPAPQLSEEKQFAPSPKEKPTYSINRDAKSGARLLQVLLDDPYLRMDPDQRSLFLGAVLRAQRRYEVEMDRIFDLNDDTQITPLELEAGQRIGAQLRQELATFLSPQQMRILGGLVGLDTFILSFFHSDAIVAEGHQ
jgi:hypothetical protein